MELRRSRSQNSARSEMNLVVRAFMADKTSCTVNNTVHLAFCAEPSDGLHSLSFVPTSTKIGVREREVIESLILPKSCAREQIRLLGVTLASTVSKALNQHGKEVAARRDFLGKVDKDINTL